MSNLVLRGYKYELNIVPTIKSANIDADPYYTMSTYYVPIDEVFRTNYGLTVYTKNGTPVNANDTTKRFIILDYGGLTPQNPKEIYSAQELYNLVLDARGLDDEKNYAVYIKDDVTKKYGRIIFRASILTARLTAAMTLQLVDAEGNALSNKAIPFNSCDWRLMENFRDYNPYVIIKPNIVNPGMTLNDPGNLPTQVYLRCGLYIAPFMGRLNSGISGDVATATIALPEGTWGKGSTKRTGEFKLAPALDYPFWCFPGNQKVLEALEGEIYRAYLNKSASWLIRNISLRRHSSIDNNIDLIQFETTNIPWSVDFLVASDTTECGR